MIVLFWNVRGLGGEGRRGQLKELIAKHRVDVICLQETIKKEFSVKELRDMVRDIPFAWSWTPAVGHSGGTLTGVKQDEMEAIDTYRGKFFSSIRVENTKEWFIWEIINVYGPVQDERKVEFLQELFQTCSGGRTF